jgi:hypothetical protein
MEVSGNLEVWEGASVRKEENRRLSVQLRRGAIRAITSLVGHKVRLVFTSIANLHNKLEILQHPLFLMLAVLLFCLY